MHEILPKASAAAGFNCPTQVLAAAANTKKETRERQQLTEQRAAQIMRLRGHRAAEMTGKASLANIVEPPECASCRMPCSSLVTLTLVLRDPFLEKILRQQSNMQQSNKQSVSQFPPLFTSTFSCRFAALLVIQPLSRPQKSRLPERHLLLSLGFEELTREHRRCPQPSQSARR